MTLPGQFFVNGVSGYIFGSQMSTDYATHNTRNTPQIQALAKSAGIPLMRCAIPANSPDSYIDQTASACAACGADMLVILSYKGGLVWNQHLVSYLGARCLLYEYGNEPDLGGITWQQYLSGWNQTIPALRKINASAAYIGPVLGVFSNYTNYMVPWLQGCVSSGVLPDAISYHIYPCTGDTSQSHAATRSTAFSSAKTKIDTAVVGVLGHALPQALTEWNMDANSTQQSYTQDPAFVNTWYAQALDNMVSAGLDIACNFDFASGAANGKLDMVDTNTYKPRLYYAPFVAKLTQYLGNLAGGGGGTGTVVNPATFYFADAAATTVSTSDQLYTAPGSPSTTWHYSRVGTSTGWGEVTSQGTTGAWAAGGSIGAQTGKGFLHDSSSLEGKQITAGTISAKVRLNCARNGDTNAQLGSITADIVVRLSKRASGGTYTTIITMTNAGQTIPAGYTTFSLSGTLGSPVTIATGEKLYIDVWLNVLTNTNASSTQDIRLNRLSVDASGKTGDANASLTVASIQTVGDSTALSLYLASATSAVKSTADQLYITSGSPTTVAHYSRVGTSTGYGEVCSSTTTVAWAASGSISSPTGNGWFFEGGTLNNQQIKAGNWSASVRLNAAQGQDTHPQLGTLTADIIMRAFRYTSDSGTYGQIVSMSLTGQTINNNFTTYSLPSTAASSTSFAPGQYLYIDIWANVTANANAASTQDIRVNRLSTDTTGLTGDTNSQIVTPGYASGATDTGGSGGVTSQTAQLTTAALNLFRDALIYQIKFAGFGTGNSALSPNSTKLDNEQFRKAISNARAGQNNGEILTDIYMAPGDAIGLNIGEVGFFGGDTATSAVNTGILIARAQFTHSNKQITESFVFELDLSYLLG